jgi:hypothetical protein
MESGREEIGAPETVELAVRGAAYPIEGQYGVGRTS